VRDELERVEIPGEDGARDRAWSVVEAAFEERTPIPQRSHWPRVAAVALALAALVAASVSAPGQAVIDEIREVVGVERAERALFSLPADGRLLVAADSGVWIVQQDGSRRLLGEYREAAWSPFGRFVVAAGANELAALEPDGNVRWSLPRPAISAPRWSGTETDTRIVYATRDRLRVVGGDGRGDRLLFSAPDVPSAPFAWLPGSRSVLAHSTQGILRVLDVQAGGEEIWSARVEQPFLLAWTRDGRRLAALSRTTLAVFDARGRRVARYELGGRATAAAIRPGSRSIALSVRMARSERSQLFTYSLDRRSRPRPRLFGGAGVFDRLAWSPGGRWLLVSWPAADQWVFVRADGRRIRAVADVSRQFRSIELPRVEGWCCAR
jgi:hypothetical protein